MGILISGGTGLVGAALTASLRKDGLTVSHLSRKTSDGSVPAFAWQPDKGKIDARAIQQADVIVNLAGAGVADKRWTPERKREIIESRTRSTALLLEQLKGNHHVHTLVNASAIGYYGSSDTDIAEETTPKGDGFLADVVEQWEEEADKIAALGIRVVKIRIGVVLSEKGGALPQMAMPVRWMVGAPLGSGRQYVSWIHLDDLVQMFREAISNTRWSGVYNATSPSPCTNADLTRAIAKELGRPLWLPAVPAFAMKLLLGEMAEMVVTGHRVQPARALAEGFKFQYPDLQEALHELLHR